MPAKITRFRAKAEYEICPLCGKGLGLPRCEKVQVEHNGVKGEVDSYYRQCTGMHGCGSDYGGAEEMRKNKKAMEKFGNG